ncbi:MAG: hypothetical protein ACYDH9_19095 [Limisphaerales bacterium]
MRELDDTMLTCFALRQTDFLFRCLTLASALWFFGHPPSSVGAETAKDRADARRDYELKVKEDELAMRDLDLKLKAYRLTKFGSIGTALALVFGYIQYRKADRWKRAEFLAREMKEFFDDLDIRNVLLMIDWAPRRINLFLKEDEDTKNYPKVTRELQVSALVPHTLRVSDGGSDPQADQDQESEIAALDGRKSTFSMEEARIRDSYDRFLDHLERFASYLQSGLVSKRELDPYLRYWIKDIAAHTDNADDAAWTCALLAYIEFYDFTKVQQLFSKYGYDITTSGTIYEKQSAAVKNLEMVRKLREACQEAKR